MSKIILFGLANDLADQLRGILRQQGHEVQIGDSAEAPEIHDAEVIFVGGDGPDYREIVTNLTEACPGTPLVLVNRYPENGRWLDALELGAADYCGAPFEAIQVKWVMGSVMRHRRKLAA